MAMSLVEKPALAGVMREQPLPSDVLDVIRIAAGSDDTLQSAAKITGKDPAAVQEAVFLYLQQMLFAPGADHYRVLGANMGAPQKKLRQHMIWLMKWLHPDRSLNDWESAFADRVLGAWDALKSPERRRQYDQSLSQSVAATTRLRRSSRPKIYRSAHRIPRTTPRSAAAFSSGRRWMLVVTIAAGLVVSVGAVVTAFFWSQSARQQSQGEAVPASLDTKSDRPNFIGKNLATEKDASNVR
jgi:hypothetical protein